MKFRVRQGDSMSPTLFNLYLNELATMITNLKLGVNVGDKNIPLLLYADDIVLFSDKEWKLQETIDNIDIWCKKWKLNINVDKTKIIHFRKTRAKENQFKFKF